MTKTYGLASLIAFVIISLVIGGLISSLAFPRTIIKEVPKNVPVEVEKIVEVEKLVTQTIDYKQEVTKALLAEISEDTGFRRCGGVKYETDEIAVKRVYDGFNLSEDSDGEQSISDVKIKLNYDEGKCFRTLVCGLNAEKELNC